MRKHLAGVYACIGASGADDIYGLAKQQRYAVVDGFLYRDGIGLGLPAVVVRSVIGEFEEITHCWDTLRLKTRYAGDTQR